MTTHSYLEYVLTILGWLINNGIWDTITATDLFTLPLLFRLFSLWLKAHEQSSNKNDAGALTLTGMENTIYVAIHVVLHFKHSHRCSQEKEMTTDPYEEIKKEIRVYAHDMNHWWKNLQSDSVAEWVLLTSFACWGIPNRFFQLCAFMLTLIFFAGKLSKLHHKHSFIDSEKRISKKIRQAPVSDIQRSALYLRLTKIKKFRRNKNVVFILKRNWRFLAGYSYLTISFVYLLNPEFFTLG
ncbi:hypothetical protein [Citrobacter amalonaticus]|uniref:hypothetical protein n=1 Tax=Citrobacter amalonaticus TaxID=35703 RepID=UPI000A63AECA|nr:hypothetical protein [Citrobacter amalonaticus]